MPEVCMQPLLSNEEGGQVGNVTAAAFPYTIGRRRDSDLRISNASVSREHCRLFERAGQVWVKDLGSLNGTFVNEEQVVEPRLLQDGDMLRVAYVVFKIHLPATAGEKTAVLSESEGPRAVIRRQVLVVEDDVNAAATLAMVLKGWGHQVRVAHDGTEALRSGRAHPPDAVLLDLRLPGMDGYQVARQLRDEVGLKEGAQVVAMTGCAEEAERPNADDSGVQKLLIKPVGADTLREVIGGA